MKFLLPLSILVINAFAVCNAAEYYWTITFHKKALFDNQYKIKVASWKTDLNKNVLQMDFPVPDCVYTMGGYDAVSDIFGEDEVAFCTRDNVEMQLRFYGDGTRFTRVQILDDTPVEHCMLFENNENMKVYGCSSEFPAVADLPAATTTTTTTTSTTTTITTTTIEPTTITTATTTDSTTTVPVTTTTTSTTNAPAPTCIAGYKGKRNGQGPTNACCSHSDDCLDSCVNEICGKGVAKPNTTTTRTTTTKTTTSTSAPTCIVGYKGKRNGQGPTKACCSHSDDCKDTCVNGACGKHP